jgi:DNA-binding transcriptional LysR family regulator
VDVSIRTGRSEQVLAMLLADEVQVGLVRSLNHPEIETIPLYEDEIVLISHPTHRFAATGRASIDEVALEPIILFDRGSSYYGLINGFLRQAGVIPNVAMELDSLEATKRMVEEGLAIALIPRVTIERELAIGVLAKVDIVDAPPPRRPISIILHKNRKRSRTAQAFMDTVCRMYQVSLPAV